MRLHALRRDCMRHCAYASSAEKYALLFMMRPLHIDIIIAGGAKDAKEAYARLRSLCECG